MPQKATGEPAQVLIINHEARLLHPTLIDPKTREARVLRWLPGLNRVDAADWAAVKDSKFVTWRFSEELLELVQSESVDITELKVTKAVGLIKTCLDRRLLAEWKGAESAAKGRSGVISAIEAQLKALDGSEAEE